MRVSTRTAGLTGMVLMKVGGRPAVGRCAVPGLAGVGSAVVAVAAAGVAAAVGWVAVGVGDGMASAEVAEVAEGAGVAGVGAVRVAGADPVAARSSPVRCSRDPLQGVHFVLG